MKTLIYLTGPQGSGKTTLADKLRNCVTLETEGATFTEDSASLIMEAKEKYNNFVVIAQDYNPITEEKLRELAKCLGAYFYEIKLEGTRYKHTLVFEPTKLDKVAHFDKGYDEAKARMNLGETPNSILATYHSDCHNPNWVDGWNQAAYDMLENKKSTNILERANQIVNERSEEKERQYGPFEDSMDNMRDIFNAITGLDLKTEHMYKAMIASKLSRERFSHKEDNLLDLCSYTGSLNNYLEN